MRQPSGEHVAHPGGGHSPAHATYCVMSRTDDVRRCEWGADPGPRALQPTSWDLEEPLPLTFPRAVCAHRVHRRTLLASSAPVAADAAHGPGRLDVRRHRPVHGTGASGILKCLDCLAIYRRERWSLPNPMARASSPVMPTPLSGQPPSKPSPNGSSVRRTVPS